MQYYVLFTQTVKQDKLKEALEKAFPADRGTVLLPRMQWWRRGRNKIELKTLYPGYVFIKTDMNVTELHGFIRAHRMDIQTFIRELGLYEKRARGEDADNEVEFKINDLTEIETHFLNQMLDENGIMMMSEGYGKKGNYTVMNGPLKAFEDRIVDVDNHNRMAYLDFTFRGHIAKAGMHLLPRKHWFPRDDDETETLEDGTEVDLGELKRMMEGQPVNSMPGS